jgi:putative ABC transport system ATP-binding protein
MVYTEDLTFQYQENKIFNFPSICCNSNETLLITGNSGVGKTTLLHLLSGLLPPKTGKIIINQTDIATLRGNKLDQFRGKNISIILQKSYFVASLNVLENLELTSWLALSKKQTALAKDLLNQLGLNEFLHKKTSELSVGQQQRVSIARALINHPKVIFADEPTSSLDDENTENVQELLTNMAKNYGASLVIVTHDSRLKNNIQKNIML